MKWGRRFHILLEPSGAESEMVLPGPKYSAWVRTSTSYTIHDHDRYSVDNHDLMTTTTNYNRHQPETTGNFAIYSLEAHVHLSLRKEWLIGIPGQLLSLK